MTGFCSSQVPTYMNIQNMREWTTFNQQASMMQVRQLVRRQATYRIMSRAGPSTMYRESEQAVCMQEPRSSEQNRAGTAGHALSGYGVVAMPAHVQ